MTSRSGGFRLLRASCAVLLFGACSPAARTPTTPDAGSEAAATAAVPDVELIAAFDLPPSPSTQTLSATWFDESTRTLFALKDKEPRIVPLAGSEDLSEWRPGTPIELTGRPNAAWDGEGLARAGGVFFVVTEETMPLVERFDGSGKYLGAVSVPAHFAKQATNNKGLESLTISPSGRFLFSANESALSIDGAPATRANGSTVRIWRHEIASNRDEERAYRTEPLGAGEGGDMGISDMLALSDDSLLVLERGFQEGYGNTVRIFRVAFTGGQNVLDVPALDDSTAVLEKKLVVDLSTLHAEGIKNPSKQPNPILDNYEALALGPLRADGRRTIFVTSDDNARAKQVARILVLALRLP